MHRDILGLGDDCKMDVDHRDSYGLNNRISNLRLCNESQNSQSKKKKRGSSSKYKGVHKAKLKWQAAIYPNKRFIHLGTFDNQEDAAVAYDIAAKKYFGSFAKLNFTDTNEKD